MEQFFFSVQVATLKKGYHLSSVQAIYHSILVLSSINFGAISGEVQTN